MSYIPIVIFIKSVGTQYPMILVCKNDILFIVIGLPIAKY